MDLVFVERVTSMLPSEKKQLGQGMIPRREPFEVLYRLNCDNLCADFSEDIEFRFSFGITAMIQRFMGKGKIAPWVISNYTESVTISKKSFKFIYLLLCFPKIYFEDSTPNGKSSWPTRTSCSTRRKWRLVHNFTACDSLHHIPGHNGRIASCRICECFSLSGTRLFTEYYLCC